MSLYRFARMTAVLSLLRRYRHRLFGMAFAIAFALVTSLLYSDIALWLDKHHPELTGIGLLVKTVVVYLALAYCFWALRPLAAPETEQLQPQEDNGPLQRIADRAASKPIADAVESPRGPLDLLAEKPRLASRQDAILKPKPAPKDP